MAAIAPITAPVAPAAPAVPGGVLGSRSVGNAFSETLTNAVSAVNAAQLDARDAAIAMANGSGADSAQAFVTIEKANVSFQFALQIRNKLLEAYQEVMRMSV
jgi:flagellar hook-basal body complex protein FliE